MYHKRHRMSSKFVSFNTLVKVLMLMLLFGNIYDMIPMGVGIMDIGEKIKTIRISKGMTLEQVGEIVGVGKSTVRKWENGDIKNMRRDKIALIAKALEVEPAYLMGWTDNEPQNDDAIWQKRESLRRDPKRRVLFDLAENGTEKDIDAAVALLDALKATNPDFYDGDDPA